MSISYFSSGKIFDESMQRTEKSLLFFDHPRQIKIQRSCEDGIGENQRLLFGMESFIELERMRENKAGSQSQSAISIETQHFRISTNSQF